MCVALEALLGQMTVVGHGRETFNNASKHLETLKAKTKRTGRGNKPPSAELVSSPPVAPDSSKARTARKPPIPTVKGRTSTAAEPLSASGTPKEAASREEQSAAQRTRKPLQTRTRARTKRTTSRERSNGRRSPSSPSSTSPPPPSSLSPPPPSLPSSRVSKRTTAGNQAAGTGAVSDGTATGVSLISFISACEKYELKEGIACTGVTDVLEVDSVRNPGELTHVLW